MSAPAGVPNTAHLDGAPTMAHLDGTPTMAHFDDFPTMAHLNLLQWRGVSTFGMTSSSVLM